MENIGKPLLSGFLPIFILVACEIFLSLIMLKHSKLRRAVCGKPIVIINKGKICQSEMKMLRMSIEDLFEQLRQNEVFSLNDVLYAIVETNGKVSILKKENNNSTDSNNSNENNSNEKQGNQNNNSQTSNLDVIVVSNGKISDSSCRLFEISHDDIKKAAKKKHMKLKDIFVMTANENGDFKIVKKEKQKK
ncbi:MAG: DUF421 domain-containing protein [Clostridia bacterium]|nr:DUF421 domain-containing protein [Clostridia bacterium]